MRSGENLAMTCKKLSRTKKAPLSNRPPDKRVIAGGAFFAYDNLKVISATF